jgi:hypothetical protein
VADDAKKKPARKRRSKAPPEPRGLTARQVGSGAPPAAVMRLMEAIESDGGTVIGPYREPLEGMWQVMAALPVDQVEPTAYQRDLSAPHVARLADAMEKLGRYVDPIVAVRAEEGMYRTPNGHHRLAALKSLGARSVVALVVPEPEVAHRILVLNTEKAHNVRERALEVIRLAEALAAMDDRAEREYAVEFEEPALLTLSPGTQAHREIRSRQAQQRARRAAGPRRTTGRARCRRRRRGGQAQGARPGEPVSQGVRSGTHQPDPVPPRCRARRRRGDREDARLGAPVRRRQGAARPGGTHRRRAGRVREPS